MLVREAMETQVVTLEPGQSIVEAARRMRDSGTGFIPVVVGSRVVGVVTDRDIVVRFVADGGEDARSMPVSEIMTSTITVVGPDDDLADAAETMRSAGIRRLAVVEGGHLAGVLSHGVLVQATACEGAGRLATLGVTQGA